MHFKRFFDIKGTNNNILIIFRNNKILYEPNLKTFLLEENLLDIQIKDYLYVGIANNGKDIYAVDISNSSDDLNIGYKSLVEYDLRHLLAISEPEDIVLMGRANQLLHWIRSNKYSGYTGQLNQFNEKEQAMYCDATSSMIYPQIAPCVLAMITKGDEILLARNNS